MSSAFEVVFYHGHRFNRLTVQALQEMERRLGYQLDVMQGSYNGNAVPASGGRPGVPGTHAGGGAVDLSPNDAHDKVHIGRQVGFAMWERPAISGLWPHHIHGILIGDPTASPMAQRQVSSYKAHRDGLISNSFDPVWHPSPIRSYVYRTDPVIGIDLSNLQVDFVNALHGAAGNRPKRRVKVVQRMLNKRMPKARPELLVDGIVGEHTLNRWGRWEEVRDVDKPNRIPDRPRLRALLVGSVYYVVD